MEGLFQWIYDSCDTHGFFIRKYKPCYDLIREESECDLIENESNSDQKHTIADPPPYNFQYSTA